MQYFITPFFLARPDLRFTMDESLIASRKDAKPAKKILCVFASLRESFFRENSFVKMLINQGLIVSLFITSSVAADADADARYDAVKSLGRLNGIALQCKYIDQVSRMKQAVVKTVPKERSFGLAFDQAANDSFLAFIQQQSLCPGPAGFEQDVSQQIELLQQTFKQ